MLYDKVHEQQEEGKKKEIKQKVKHQSLFSQP